MRKISADGLALIKKWEGCRLEAYICPAGFLTIGYGHTKHVHAGDRISMSQATRYLLEDLAPIEKALNRMSVQLTQGQFDALCSFCFNLGLPAFNKSTLKKYILAGKGDAEICAQFRRWVYAGGKVMKGLVNRREDECRHWCM